jgi:hypothetical protein
MAVNTPAAMAFVFLKICVCSIQINHQPDATILQFIILTFLLPIIRSSMTAVAASCFTLYHGDSRAVFAVGPTANTARLSPRYKGKTRGCYCSH